MAFADTTEFESWLERQPPAALGAWIKFSKRGAPIETLTKSEAIGAALCFGWVDR